MAKSRVSPISYVTIPRLELQGSLAGVRLAKLVCQELNLTMSAVTFWIDSMTVSMDQFQNLQVTYFCC